MLRIFDLEGDVDEVGLEGLRNNDQEELPVAAGGYCTAACTCTLSRDRVIVCLH